MKGIHSSRMATNPPNTMVMSVPPGPAGFSTPSNPSSNSSSPGSSYVVNSKIMVVAVAVLFAVVLFILCLHIYAKWFWRNQGSIAAGGPGTLSWRIRRRYRDDPNAQNFNQAFVNLQSVGLEKSVVEALPTFEYKPSEMNSKLECVVCLEEFEDGEKGRTLPKCGHNFHLDCIDMWLHSHSTCPLCRASVQPPDAESMEKAVTPASSVAAASAVVIAITTDSPNSSPSETVVGDVQAPFMAAMRASRRRRGLGLGSPLSPAVTNSLPRTAEDHQDAQAAGTDSSMRGGEHQQQSRALGNESSATQTPSGADPKLNAAKTSSKIPSNVLFWGNQTQVNTSAGSINPPRSSSLRAPFQVAIDIPRASSGGAAAAAASSDSGSSSSFTNLMSPMMRASASFRRLLSQGRNAAVSPHTPSSPDDAAAGSSSSLPPPNV